VTAAFASTPIDWQQLAACAAPGIDPELFFPAKGGSARPAKRICARCPVKAPCLAEALTLPPAQDAGVRGGLTPQERRWQRESVR
jgi:WhiB family transcriptional regulator, redox-sensing transcriptional regulator